MYEVYLCKLFTSLFRSIQSPCNAHRETGNSDQLTVQFRMWIEKQVHIYFYSS